MVLNAEAVVIFLGSVGSLGWGLGGDGGHAVTEPVFLWSVGSQGTRGKGGVLAGLGLYSWGPWGPWGRGGAS